MNICTYLIITKKFVFNKKKKYTRENVDKKNDIIKSDIEMLLII